MMNTQTADLNAILQEIRDLAQSIASPAAPPLGHLQVQQIESYVSLISFLQPRFPFPSMGSGAIAPDLALLFASRILEKAPSLILETGSGISTLVAGYCLQKNGKGKIVSLEHNLRYAEEAETSVRLHGLDRQVQVIYSPLSPVEIQGEIWSWYDTCFLQKLEPLSIDFLFVDGPPGRIRTQSRYPALPILSDKLSDVPLIFIDDSDRADESEMIALWLRDNPFLRRIHLGTARSSTLLTGDRKLRA